MWRVGYRVGCFFPTVWVVDRNRVTNSEDSCPNKAAGAGIGAGIGAVAVAAAGIGAVAVAVADTGFGAVAVADAYGNNNRRMVFNTGKERNKQKRKTIC